MTRPAKTRTKRFLWEDLLDLPDMVDERCACIELLTLDLALFPRTWHERTADALLQHQEYVPGRAPLVVERTAMRRPLEQLAEKLEAMSGLGFVHGDISLINTIWDGTTLHLVDFEPSLRQTHQGRSMVKSPKELRAYRDKRGREVTTRTDRVAFFLLCARLLGRTVTRGPDGIIYAAEAMAEDNLTALSFFALLQMVANQSPLDR